MEYIRFFLIICLMYSVVVCYGKSCDELASCHKQIEDVNTLLRKRLEAQQEEEQGRLDQMQSYAKSAFDIAGVCMVVIPDKGIKSNQNASKLLSAIPYVKISLSCFLVLSEVVRWYRGYQFKKNLIELLSYEEFVEKYPHLVHILYSIKLIHSLVKLSSFGTLPQKVFSRIQLVKMALPKPFDKAMNECAKKLYQHSFDARGRFQLIDYDALDHPYTKFYDKVPQDFKDLCWYEDSFLIVSAQDFESEYVLSIENDYNNALIEMIDAGMNNRLDEVLRFKQKYSDRLMNQLYQYYKKH